MRILMDETVNDEMVDLTKLPLPSHAILDVLTQDEALVR